MNRAPGRGVTCGARWMENLPHNWKWTWLNFSFSSPRECHKYASCVMSFEGAEDLASCRWFLEVKTRNEDHGLTNWAMPSDPIMEKWKWIIFRCPDGFHGDGETSCLPGDPEPSQVCLPCLHFSHLFCCIRYSSNQFGTDSCIFSNYIHTLVLRVRAMEILYI